jgi:hypothetical protein
MIVAEMRAGTLNLGASMQCKAIWVLVLPVRSPQLACLDTLDSTTGGGI